MIRVVRLTTQLCSVICHLAALQVVTDQMWEARASRFPEHTPNTREYYLLRSIFEEQFPSQQAMATVPKVCVPAAGLSLIHSASCSN